MRKAGKWLIRIAVTAILFLLLSGSASAEGKRLLTAACPSVCGAQVTARWQKDQAVLSIPGSWDLSKVTLEMEDTKSLQLGQEKTRAVPGKPVDMTGMVGKKTAIRDEKGRLKGYLTILQGSQINALFLEVDAEQLVKANADKTIQITEGHAVCVEADGTVSYDGELEQLKSRGNASHWEHKKPYQFKLKKKTSLGGMSKGKTWILLANWADDSLLRNQIVLDLSRQIGMRNAVKCVQTDLWINGEYNGLYLMTEKIQIKKERINITNLEEATEKVNPSPFDAGQIAKDQSGNYPIMRNYPDVKDPEDITGGYIVTIEKEHRLRLFEEQPGFRTAEELNIRIKEPTCPSKRQAEYLFNLITEMQDALIASDGINPKTGKPYEEYLDVNSFAQRYLIDEWTENYDFQGGSQYMYKDSDLVDPLIYAGPSWDYDTCLGDRKDKGYRTSDLYLTNKRYRKNWNIFWLLYGHDSFRNEINRMWPEVFRPAIDLLLGTAEAGPDSVLRPLDEYVEAIRDSAAMNYVKWHMISDGAFKAAGTSLDSSIRNLRAWMTKRAAWMDKTYYSEGQTD
ncbi:MAG: CotH kinase family protein [Clostridiales bacterium]|nr:CotH kinase family protein [Clostridiales bacterium]